MRDRLEKLRELLLADRTALLSGDFSNMKANSALIDALVDELEKTPAEGNAENRALAEEVQKLSAKNASLLQAGIEGAKAAKEKIDMIKRATSQLNTYTSEGTVQDVNPKAGKVEKRA